MTYVEAPTYYTPDENPKLFLAGGITNCPDWQSEAAETIERLGRGEITVFNPRRKDFPIEDPSAAEEQIKWEFDHLRLAHVILFWFCEKETQPIALYELGAWSMTTKRLAIGVHEDYPRLQDVAIQTDLVRPDQGLCADLGTTVRYALVQLAKYVPSSREPI